MIVIDPQIGSFAIALLAISVAVYTAFSNSRQTSREEVANLQTRIVVLENELLGERSENLDLKARVNLLLADIAELKRLNIHLQATVSALDVALKQK